MTFPRASGPCWTFRSRPGIPAGLEDIKPGPALGAILSTIDVSAVSGTARVAVLQAHQRQVSHYEAARYHDMTAISDYMLQDLGDDLPDAVEAAAFEIRAALRLTRRAAETELGLALDLRERLSAVGDALARGDIDFRRARKVAYGTAHLSDEDAGEVVDRIIERAPQLTTGQLGAMLRQLCFTVDPDESKSRYEQALQERRVYREATEAGTANLMILGAAPDRAAEATNLINKIALDLKTADETRTLDQLRTDIALDLLCGRANSNRTGKGTIDIHVDLTTLTELNNNPGELAGYGPVIADIARQVTEHQQQADWRYTITNPDTGIVVDNGTTRRRPKTSQERHVHARNRTCITPGCRMPQPTATSPRLSARLEILRISRSGHPARQEFRPQPKLQRLGAAETRPLQPPQTRVDIQTHPRRRLPMDQPPRTQIHNQRTTTPIASQSFPPSLFE